ncbi:TetR/AcrR family transcriptional regulator [Streptomyces sp. NBC_00063]|uniref:TetR/AcrR family transcriptional regulator n=1 Tax=Streptomyces sp. NBC_00063 TaxID=2975638 RepID=UPI003D73E3C1
MHLKQPLRRRRGAQLEDALLTAAWGEIREHGYGGLTFEGVAARAHTSRSVVRRRWADKQELARAAVAHQGQQIHTDVPDTGTLRGDVLGLLSHASERLSGMLEMFIFRFGVHFAETGTSLAELRATYLGDRKSSMDAARRRAAERGEIDSAVVPTRISRLPFDLVRNEVIMTLGSVPVEVLEEIVDTIFLPLVQPGPAGDRRRS